MDDMVLKNAFIEALNAHTRREEARLEQICDQIGQIRSILNAQSRILDTHIQRSERLEALVDLERESIGTMKLEHAKSMEVFTAASDQLKALEKQLKPINRSLRAWAVIGQLVSFAVAASGLTWGILKLISIF
jgi:transposase